MNLTAHGDELAEPTGAALRWLEDARASILEQLSEGVIIAGADGKLLFVNPAAAALHGVNTLDVAPDAYSETYHLLTMEGATYPFADLPLARAVRKGDIVEDARWRIRRPDGSEIVAIGSARPLIDAGRQIGAILTLRDDSERFDAERRVRESEAQVRLVLDSAAGAFYSVDRDGNTTLVSRGFLEMMGFARESEAMGQKLHAIIHHSHPDGSRYRVEQCPIYQCARTGTSAHVPEEVFSRLDGTPVPVEYWVAPIMRGDEHVGATCTITDLTERKATDAVLRESEARFRNMADHAPVMMWVTEPDGYCSYLNRGWYDFTGQTEAEALGFGWLKAVHPDDAAAAERAFVEANAKAANFRVDYRLRRADGVYRWAIDAASPRFGAEGQFIGFVGSVIDIDERREAEDALRERSEEFFTLADNIPALAWMAYANGDIFWYNRRWYDYTGTTPESQAGWGWEAVHDPAVLPSVVERWTASLHSGQPFDMTFPLRGADGQYRPFLTRVVPIRDDQGEVVRWFGTNIDVSEQVAVEQALSRLNETLDVRVAEEVARRGEAEELLRQSQKMETLGQLTGGIAHDFNNLLQIITGNLDILRRSIPADPPRLQRSVENAFKGAERAAILTQRLLAFSRRQPLVPKVFDPNKLVSGMSDLLHRAIGETIAIETVLGSGLWRVEADSNQLENALLNLAVNSRDAMPDGGKLMIETANTHLDRGYAELNSGVVAGQYVVICVSDTGSGMDAVTAERAFDPFFTTKEVGKGTGLGLSMVYGFVKQSGGHLKIYSEPDEGTTIKIYLPRHHGAEVDVEDTPYCNFAPKSVKGETILVCEDDDDVRAYSVHSLSELGYQVIEASDGPSALRMLESAPGRVDLLFTDIVLPGGMTGAMVAEAARTIKPGLKVLFTTGYARNAIVHHGRLDPGVELLSKPFSYADLAARVREMLDTR